MSSPITASSEHPLPSAAPRSAALPADDQPQMNGESALEAKRRRYSIDLFNYTNDQWKEIRKNMDQRRGSVSDESTTSSTQSSTTSSTQSSPAEGESGIAAAQNRTA